MTDKLARTLSEWLDANAPADPQPAQPSDEQRAVAEAFGFDPDALPWTTNSLTEDTVVRFGGLALLFYYSEDDEGGGFVPAVMLWLNDVYKGFYYGSSAAQRGALVARIADLTRPTVVTFPAANTTLADTYASRGYVWRQTVVNNGVLVHVFTLDTD